MQTAIGAITKVEKIRELMVSELCILAEVQKDGELGFNVGYLNAFRDSCSKDRQRKEGQG